MAKLTTYMAILSMVILGFHMAGLMGDTPISWLMDLLLNPENLSEHTFFATALGILTLFSGIAIVVIGTTIPERLEQAATITFATLLLIIGWDMIAIFNVLRQTSYPLALFIVSPVLVIYILSVIEWWRGIAD